MGEYTKALDEIFGIICLLKIAVFISWVSIAFLLSLDEFSHLQKPLKETPPKSALLGSSGGLVKGLSREFLFPSHGQIA